MNIILSRPFDSRVPRSLRAGSDGEESQSSILLPKLRSFALLRMTAPILLLIAVPAFAATGKKLDDSRPRPSALTVTLDVKDAEVREILKSMQRQCVIKNLIIDPQVQGKGTFFIRDVPCSTAFNIVLRTLSLKSVTYSNTLTTVERRR